MRVERIELVSAFAQDDAVLLTHGATVKSISDQFRGRVAQLNVPDRAPPELPRLIIRFEDAVLQVGLNRFQMVMQPPSHVAEGYEDAMHFARDRAIPVFSRLTEGETHKQSWSGVVVTIAIPQDATSALGAAAPAFSRLMKLDWDTGALATFNVQAGFRAGGFFRNYVVTGYEVRNVAVQAPFAGGPIHIDPSEGALVEAGISVAIDVNTKPPQDRLPPMPELAATLTEHQNAFQSLGKDLNLEGLV